MSEETLLPVSGLRRWFYISLGWFFVGLAVLGTLLPILPTTPFLLLASFFFARSNPALQTWLFRLPLWGSLLRDWQMHRGVRPIAKLTAFVAIPTVIVSSAVLANLPSTGLVLLCVLGVIGLVVVGRLPVVPPRSSNGNQPTASLG